MTMRWPNPFRLPQKRAGAPHRLSSRKKAKQDIARYIEIFCNRQRLHSAFGYRTPHEVRNECLNEQLAA